MKTTRFVEFGIPNRNVYSIEFAQILMASAAEVDVLAKLILSKIDASAPRRNIDDYRALITGSFPSFASFSVVLPRFGLRLQPWEAWSSQKNPDWWRAYTDVKHERDQYFSKATLENALSSMAGLLVMLIQYYRLQLAPTGQLEGKVWQTTSYLSPESTLLRLDGDFYTAALTLGPAE